MINIFLIEDTKDYIYIALLKLSLICSFFGSINIVLNCCFAIHKMPTLRQFTGI
jgi:hypothetical protein